MSFSNLKLRMLLLVEPVIGALVLKFGATLLNLVLDVVANE
jgi:hypothetical protein